MKHFLIILLFIPCFSFGQNLVPNYSFEDTLYCPLPNIMGSASPWFQPTSGTPDHFHPCNNPGMIGMPDNVDGFQFPATGDSYAGIMMTFTFNTREYVEAPLSIPLIKGQDYCTDFLINLADRSRYAIDRIGLKFSVDSLYSNDQLPLLFTPDIANPKGNMLSDTVNWVLISGAYNAAGGERFITIGNFYEDDSTTLFDMAGPLTLSAYYYIDDVYVRPIDPIPLSAQASKDTTICLGDSVTISHTAQAGYSYFWPPAADITNSFLSQHVVSPTQTISYLLYIEDTTPKPYSCQTYMWDTVTITVIDCDTIDTIPPPKTENVVWLPNIFSPNGDGNNDVLYVRGSNIADIAFTIFNRWGQQVFNSTTIDAGWAGTYLNEPLNDGVFAYRVTGTYTDGTSFAIKGNVTLVR